MKHKEFPFPPELEDSRVILERIRRRRMPPLCERCYNQMTPQYYQEKVTWWTCEKCADEEDSEPPKNI